MATYNKRGYKAPKPVDENGVETEFVNDQQSETAEVFNTLDSKAVKIGGWFTRNQKAIFGTIGVLAVAAVGYLGYQHLILEPKEEKAAGEMFQAEEYFNQAVNGVASDSLFNLALKGGEGKMGFLAIADTYSGTKTAKLANYYAGTAYLNMGKYKEAIQHLEKFSSEDLILQAMAYGAIGDAFSELNQKEDALDYYKKAANHKQNDYSTPRYAFKAGLVALDLGKKEEALKFFNDIKTNYKATVEGSNIDFYIGLAE